MIILTGGAGFIGSVMLQYLNAAGHRDVLVVDNLRSGDKWKNLYGKVFSDYWQRERLLEELRADRLPENIEAIIHLGASSYTTEKDLNYLIQNNYRYSIELAQYCSRRDIRFIYASSAATYGDGKLGFSDNGQLESLKPLNPYGFSKQLFDLWAESNKILDKSVGLKFFNVFGPNEYHKGPQQSMALKGFQQIQTTGKLKLYKSGDSRFADGGQMRDFLYVKDCCKTIMWFLENKSVAGIFNVGGGQARTWNDLASALFDACNLPLDIEYIDMPAELARQYQNFTEAKVEKLFSAGFKEKFLSLEDSVKDYVSNYLSNNYAFH